MGLLDRIHSGHLARARAGFSKLYGRTPSRGELIDEGFELLEVIGTTAIAGASEAYWGEEATTVLMSDQKDTAGQPIKDDKGNTLKVSGTGLPYTGLVAGGLLVAVNFGVIAHPAMRKHATNIAVGLGSAFGYRKAFAWGQKKRDAADKAAGKPLTYGVNQFGGTIDPASIQGERGTRQMAEGPSAEVISILRQAREEVLARNASGQR